MNIKAVLVLISIFSCTSAQSNLEYYGDSFAHSIGYSARFGCILRGEKGEGYIGDLSIKVNGTYAKVAKFEAGNLYVYESAPMFLQNRVLIDKEAFVDGSLLITLSQVQVGDDTDWKCSLEFNKKIFTHEFSLRIYKRPKISMEIFRPVYPGEETVVGECIVSEIYPMPKKLWIFENNYVPNEDWNTTENNDKTFNIKYELRMTPSIMDHKKRFKCSIFGTFGIDTRSSLDSQPILVFHNTSAVDFELEPNPNVLGSGESTYFFCSADGYPIQDFFIAKRLSNGSTIEIARSKKNDSNSLSFVQKVAKEQAGTYFCKANEIYQESNMEVYWTDEQVTIHAANSFNGTEMLLNSYQYSVMVGENFQLSCDQDGYPFKPKVMWKVDEKLHDQATVEIKNANLSDSGRYECVSNISRSSKLIIVTVKPACNPTLTTNVTRSDKGVDMAVKCAADENRGSFEPLCEVVLKVELEETSEVKKSTNQITLSYERLGNLTKQPFFSCTAKLQCGDIFFPECEKEMFAERSTSSVNKTETNPLLFPQPFEDGSGMTTGLLVGIVVIVVLVVFGLLFIGYRFCNNASVTKEQIDEAIETGNLNEGNAAL